MRWLGLLALLEVLWLEMRALLEVLWLEMRALLEVLQWRSPFSCLRPTCHTCRHPP